MGKSTISMAIFHCYVSSPEGIHYIYIIYRDTGYINDLHLHSVNQNFSRQRGVSPIVATKVSPVQHRLTLLVWGPRAAMGPAWEKWLEKSVDISKIGRHMNICYPKKYRTKTERLSYFCGTWPIEIDYLWWSTYSTWWMFQKCYFIWPEGTYVSFLSEIDPHNMDVPQNKMPENHQLLQAKTTFQLLPSAYD